MEKEEEEFYNEWYKEFTQEMFVACSKEYIPKKRIMEDYDKKKLEICLKKYARANQLIGSEFINGLKELFPGIKET